MEALVESSSNAASRFYCHSCSIELDRVTPDFTCPHCMLGFIEELPAADRERNSPASPTMDYNMPPEFSNSQIPTEAIRLAGEFFSNSVLSPLILNVGGAPRPGAPDSDGGAAGGPVNDANGGIFTLDDGSAEAAGGSGIAAGGGAAGNGGPSVRHGGRLRGNRRRGMHNFNNLDNILREILISVADGGANFGAGGTPMFFMGNPGDYAWGREGIDTIVTQLLNQMDNTGPPPLEKEKIAEIPKVTINAEQVEMKLQCSVCWEDFQIDELVRKLPCSHVYHETCIIPWLELHGTCPICRKSLTPEQSQQTQRPNGNSLTFTVRPVAGPDFLSGIGLSTSAGEEGASTSSPLATLEVSQQPNAGFGPAGNPSSSSHDSHSATNAGNSNSNSNSSRYRDDDGNIDYEYD